MNTSAAAAGPLETDSRALQRAGFLVFGLLTLSYVVFFARLTSFPYQDFPNHLTRAVVLADLLFHDGATFGRMFDFSFMPVPYILGDLALAGLVQLFGATAAGTLWTLLVLLSWPAALLFLAHVTGLSRNGRLFVLLVGLFLATDWFFLLAFTQFRLAMALMVVALGVAHLLRLRWTGQRFAWFCVLLAVGYFTHLVYVIFLAPCLIVSGAVRLYFRRTNWRTELMLVAPVLAVMAWHFGYADHAYRTDAEAPYTWLWGTPALKIDGLQSEFIRYGTRFAKAQMLLFAIAICWGLWHDLRSNRLLKPQVVEPLALAVTFLGIYVVLPSRYSQAAYVDVRALLPIFLFVVLARVHLADEASTRTPLGGIFSLTLVALLSLLNLGYLALHVPRNDAWGMEYRALVARIPNGASVLPIYTGGREGAVAPRLHMGSYAVMDRAALNPYLFSGDAGHPMKYFRYRQRPYTPPQRWYNAVIPETVDWRAIACSYDFLLVDKPYNPARIEVQTLPVAGNASAALLAIRADAAIGCTPEKSGSKPIQ